MPAVRRMLVTVRTPVDEVLDVDDVADDSGRARRASPTAADVGRVDELDLEAGVERVRVEVAGQVLAALRRHRGAEALERLVAVDVGRPTATSGIASSWAWSASTWLALRVRLQVGDDLDLLLGELEAGQQAGLDDPEAGQQQEHQDHRRGRREAHDARCARSPARRGSRLKRTNEIIAQSSRW